MPSSNRDDFTKPVKDLLAKRVGLLCSYCRCLTTGARGNDNMTRACLENKYCTKSQNIG